MMKSTTEFIKENADFLEKLKNADAVICMDRSKVKDTCIDNNICNYLQQCYFADIYNMVHEDNISAYLLSYGFRPNVIDIYDSYYDYDSIYIGSYEDIKNCLNNESNMEYFKLPIIIDELNVTAYFNKNKYKMTIQYGFLIYEDDEITGSCYNISICDKTNEKFNEHVYFGLNGIDINKTMNLIKNLNCDEENKNKYYCEVVEAMNYNNLFQKRISTVKDFEDKMLLLEIYKSIFDK